MSGLSRAQPRTAIACPAICGIVPQCREAYNVSPLGTVQLDLPRRPVVSSLPTVNSSQLYVNALDIASASTNTIRTTRSDATRIITTRARLHPRRRPLHLLRQRRQIPSWLSPSRLSRQTQNYRPRCLSCKAMFPGPRLSLAAQILWVDAVQGAGERTSARRTSPTAAGVVARTHYTVKWTPEVCISLFSSTRSY
jgi:hypothetical protein